MPVAPVAPVAVPAEAGAPRPRRRGRTAALIAGAAVLGVVAGTCAGYLVQADREPTRLASLSQPRLAQAKGPAPEPLSAARDRRVRTDGDLRELLVKKPAGMKAAEWLDGSDGWMDLAEYADSYEDPAEMFGNLVGDEFRRAAVTGWEGSTSTVEVRLIQFRQEEAVAAADSADSGHYWADAEDSTDSWAVPGTADGRAYVHKEPETEAGYLPLYSAEAHAWRGDIAMEIWIYDSEPISKKAILDLATRQMERL
ncbi:hypothetical protein [Streptomyces sp. ALI-76-A]|uniref:hypothetical protein n=1 Tax=Streptomyces sp. ALI-76-A TaxID=3025736 RepID=UPI00256EA46C|nr:hypothetical protein [Streptomyces sp. ALI-76-A]MDL5202394.1 hypothetical protein [Streptomyces sp. ALI-76-A]